MISPIWPDLVVIATPAAMVPGLIAGLGSRGCAAAIVLTAGLGHGPGSLAEAAERAARQRLRIVGPNCLGVLVPGQSSMRVLPQRAACRRPGADFAVRRDRRGLSRMGCPAFGRIFGRSFDWGSVGCRFRRPTRLFRARSRHPGNPALHRVDQGCA